MINTIAFDFDGTLANTNQLIINSFKHIYSTFCKDDFDEKYIMSTFGEPLATTLSRDFEDFDFEDVIASYREYQVDRFNDEVFLYNNVERVLEFLKSKGMKIGIVTSRLRNSTVAALREFKIEQYFDVVVCADDVERHKPHKEPLIKAITELNSRVENTLYVGDSKFDMECALNANVTPVLAGWQPNSEKLAEKYKIKNVIQNMWEITELI
jgi:pyrophosphatase PpaX